MAIFPSIMELFGQKAPPAPMSAAQTRAASSSGAPEQQTQVANLPNDPSQPLPVNGLQSKGEVPAFPATPTGDASPLSEYKKIWETPLSTVTAASLVPEINADPVEMMKAARGVDFTKAMDPASLDLAMKGDQNAFAAVINQAVQAGFAQAAAASVNITKAALSKQATEFETKYAPQMMRNNNIREAVESKISLSSNPAAAPIVDALTRQLSNTFPTATPDEVAVHVEKYLQEFSKSSVEAAGGRVQSKQELAPRPGQLSRKETDWEALLSDQTTTSF